MSKSDNSKEQPRRKRLPHYVYRTAEMVRITLTPNDYTNRPVDETLCREIAPALREMADLAHLELSEKVNRHPHADPARVEWIIQEAMRLACGIGDLVKAGKRVDKTERQRSLEIWKAFHSIQEAYERSIDRERHTETQSVTVTYDYNAD